MNLFISASAIKVFTDIGYVLLALFALMVMIVVHELGHYTAGKLLGFKIDEFGIGFGPALFKHTNKKNGEVFTIRPFPIGGFCAFHGEDEDGKEDKDAFNNQKAWKRLIVLFAGAFMNFISAIMIISIYFSAYGQVLPRVNYVPSGAETNVNMLQKGDYILRINGKQVNLLDLTDFYKIIDNMNDSSEIKVLRNGKLVKLNVQKQYYSTFKTGDMIIKIDGKQLDTPILPSDLSSHPDAVGKTRLNLIVKYVDADANELTYPITVYKGNPSDATNFYAYDYGIHSMGVTKLPFHISFARSFSFCFFIVFKILASLGLLITGKLGLESAGGTITVIKTMAEVSSLGFGNFLYVTAIISANLAVMNLLPLPALDGSRMVFTLIEMIFRKPVPRKVEAAIHTVGLILLLVLAVFLDVFHLAHI